MKQPLRTLEAGVEGEEVGEIELDDTVFGIEPRRDILARVVNWQLARRRAGTHNTRRVSDIRGTTAKPWRQKGTGRSRQGSMRSAQFRGGAAAHGPVSRSHAHSLPKKVRRLGLRSALSGKLRDGKLVVVDNATASGRTRELVDRLASWGWTSVLFIAGPEPDQGLCRAARNIPRVDVLPQQGANVYDILRRDVLVLTADAVEHLEARLK